MTGEFLVYGVITVFVMVLVDIFIIVGLYYLFNKPQYPQSTIQFFKRHEGFRCQKCSSWKIIPIDPPQGNWDDCKCKSCGATWAELY